MTTENISKERKLAIEILEKLAERIGNEDFFDNAEHKKGAKPDSEWYVYEDLITEILTGNKERAIYEKVQKNTKLFYKQTDGGAEYLCTKAIEGTNVGDLKTMVVRLDGNPILKLVR